MDCEQVRREEVAQRYLQAQLSETEQAAFEEHYFECARCVEELRTLQNLRSELQRSGASILAEPVPAQARWQWAWAAALAVLLVALGFWYLRGLRGPGMPQTTATPVAVAPKPPQPVQPLTLADLARVEPPVYHPVVLRDTSDATTLRFHQAMQHYQKQQYSGAIPGLHATILLNPTAAEAHFYLGACYLATGDTSPAIAEFRRTLALGESPYQEDAHFYLAKALLRQGDAAAAGKELEATAKLHGDRENLARELLRQLQAISRKQP